MWIKDVIDIIFGLGLFFNALLFVPQAIKIFQQKNSQDLSLLTFAGFNTIQFFGALHAYFAKDGILFFGMVLSFITCGTITLLILIYRR